MAVNYFKWAEAKLLATTTKQKVTDFTWKDVITRYRPLKIITVDNNRQVIGKKIEEYYKGL